MSGVGSRTTDAGWRFISCLPIRQSLTPPNACGTKLDDCRSPLRGSAFYADRYTFSGTAGQPVSLLLTAPAFDTYLYLIGPTGAVVAQDDDGGGGTNSRIPPTSGVLTLPSTGTYLIEVTSYAANATGAYTLTMTSAGGGAPTAVTDPATNVTSAGARLNGQVTPNGSATTVVFQWGTTTAYGTTTPGQTIGSGTSAVAVWADLTGLQPNTTYHYRVSALNLAGAAEGVDHTFKTKPAPRPRKH